MKTFEVMDVIDEALDQIDAEEGLDFLEECVFQIENRISQLQNETEGK